MTAPPNIMAEPVIAPQPAQNQVDAVGQRSAEAIAAEVLNAHKAGLQARREADLLAEKFLLHIDGTGDLQWADILYGSQVEIPRLISEFRKTENILRLVTDNAVAHHTTMPLHFFADSAPNRRAKETALIDSLWMNYVSQNQDLNGLSAEVLYLAIAAGFCPLHVYWRDNGTDGYQPIPDPEAVTTRGMLDCWVGNPFDTVFDPNATRGSVHWCSYGRSLPAAMVRAAFDHIPAARNMEGSKKEPSAAEFQRIARSWRFGGLGVHGSGVMNNRTDVEKVDETIQLICKETLPGVLADWPAGRLQIVAVPGTSDLRRSSRGAKHAILLAEQPLPAGDFSWTNFYSHQRYSDVHGKPWIEDLDQLQIDLNLALSKRWEVVNRMFEAPIVAPGGAISEDMADMDGYNILEIEPALANWHPRVMEWPQGILVALDKEVEEKRRALYTAGGYQASSRGEAPGSRMAYRAIVALQQADSSIHGPVNQRFQRSMCDFARKCWKQMKAYGDVPWAIDIVGDEYAHLAEPYIDNTKLSDRPPKYRLVNTFGSTPELRQQEVLELVQLRGADGEVFLPTEEARRQYPNSTLFANDSDPRSVQQRRARTISQAILTETRRFRELTGFMEEQRNHPWMQRAAMEVFRAIEEKYPRLRNDELSAHIASLTEITQDETIDVMARMAAGWRQDLYYEWQASMAGMPAQTASPGKTKQERSQTNPRSVAEDMAGGDAAGGRTVAAAAQ